MPTIFQEVEKALVVSAKTNNKDAYYLTHVVRNFYLALQSNSAYEDWGCEGKSEAEMLPILAEKYYSWANINYYFWKLYYLYLMGDYPQAIEKSDAIPKWLRLLPTSMYLWITYYFISPLALIGLYDSLPKKEQKKRLKQI